MSFSVASAARLCLRLRLRLRLRLCLSVQRAAASASRGKAFGGVSVDSFVRRGTNAYASPPSHTRAAYANPPQKPHAAIGYIYAMRYIQTQAVPRVPIHTPLFRDTPANSANFAHHDQAKQVDTHPVTLDTHPHTATNNRDTLHAGPVVR